MSIAPASASVSDEATAAVMQMFREDPFTGFKGKYFDLPQRHVLPRVVQKPHPPLWVAASNLTSYERAGRQGVGVIGVTRNSIDETRDSIRAYRDTIRSSDPKGFIGELRERAGRGLCTRLLPRG